ncbi:Mitochondrial distribution and morphology protein 12 [Yamadazyma tenuis]|uniref:Mitochondrial distribution and morphology protein 12 n=1 Tax=Candida tenuis TaxID=2315449 RepID=UPI0027A74A9C|nr:Mitochondrial distribution and morphology protein 12 [Yamadazyma tenuis]
MSFDINWDNLVGDESINESIRRFLDEQLQSLTLPSFISDLSVSGFDLGSTAPDISILHVGDPFDEFYDENLKDIDERLKSLNMSYMHGRNSYEYSSDEDDYNDHPNDNDNASTNISILEFPKIGGKSGAELHRQEQTLTRSSSDSLSLMLGNSNLNFLHNHNLNNLGLGNLNSPSHIPTRADTPTRFLNHVTRPGSYRDPSSFTGSDRHENDIQLTMEVNYHGDLEINVLVNLLVNYPSPKFISLPIKLHITGLVIHSIAVVAYLRNSVFVSFLCDVNEQTSDYFSSSIHSYGVNSPANPGNSGGNFVEYINSSNTQERIDIIKKVKIESEIGGVEQNVLRNVGKVEKFLIDGLRSLLREEVAWPSWLCFDLSDDDDHESASPNASE